MIVTDKIFREYDIRGEVNKDFDAEFAYLLGLVFAEKAVEELGKKPEELTIGVGHDCRLSTPEIKKYFFSGLLKSGVKVLDCGMGPTPQAYHSVVTKNLSAGVQITASHNPSPDNGFKMMVGKRTLSGPDIKGLGQSIKIKLESGVTPEVIESHQNLAQFNAREAYLEDLYQKSKNRVSDKRKIKVVVDGGNGVGGLVGPELLRKLGCEVVEIYCEPDGLFPNHHPDPTVVENLKDLQQKVVEEKADFGIAWDGDADRIGVVDEKGTPIFGDMLLVVFGRALLKEEPSATIIGDVKCSNLMFEDLASKGANVVMSRTGHSLIKAKLKELNAHLAGEMSGHMFFVHNYYGFDDAIYASARLVEIVSNFDGLFSELLSDLPQVYTTPEIRVECPEEIKFSVVDKALGAFSDYDVNTTDGVRISFENGWGLVRASNTQPVLVMRFEAQSEKQLSEYQEIVQSRVEGICKQLESNC